MTPIRTGEERLLQGAADLVARFASAHGRDQQEARFQILEAASSRLGGFDLDGFHAAFHVRPMVPVGRLLDSARTVVAAIGATGIPPALALSALAREDLAHAQRRAAGVYHTDFRLAQHLAASMHSALRPGVAIVDPACGAGMLLAAVSLAACGRDRVLAAEWLRHSVHAADLSATALRAALLSLASLTDDVAALAMMRRRWLVQDSLLAGARAWTRLAPEGFDAVVANPPWEKIKLSRHEFIKRNGGTRHYGAEYADHDLSGYETGQLTAAARSSALARLYPALASGEPDLYVAFTELLLRLTRPGGAGAVFVPGGIIRSQNTGGLRRLLMQRSRALSFTVIENRAKFFAIDTRFKFVLCRFDAAGPKARKAGTIRLAHASGTEYYGVQVTAPVRMARETLASLSADLTIPEVRDAREWQLFQKMQHAGLGWSDRASPWYPAFCREVDMTRDTPRFRRSPGPDLLALIEGRMIQPHRFGAKAYHSGQGRSALWTALPLGAASVAPQFWIAPESLPASVATRANTLRAGFCDITGQTNERSMMAALIPAGVVCGNKVPTIVFPNDPSEDRLFLWAAIVNSLPFDWALRRVITTTVNYFLLLGLALPRIEPDSLPGRRLVDIARRLALLDRAETTGTELDWRAAELRAEADALVALSYGLSQDDLLLMFRDFPLLDRGQPAILDEPRSTITRDCVLGKFAVLRHSAAHEWADRLKAAKRLGAVAYIPGKGPVNPPVMEPETSAIRGRDFGGALTIRGIPADASS